MNVQRDVRNFWVASIAVIGGTFTIFYVLFFSLTIYIDVGSEEEEED